MRDPHPLPRIPAAIPHTRRQSISAQHVKLKTLPLTGTFALGQRKQPYVMQGIVNVEFQASLKMLRTFSISLNHTSPAHKLGNYFNCVQAYFILCRIPYSGQGTSLCNLLFVSFLLWEFFKHSQKKREQQEPQGTHHPVPTVVPQIQSCFISILNFLKIFF